MLATLSTSIARAKRSRQPLPVLEVQQFATAEAAILAAEVVQKPLVLLCNGSERLARAILSIAHSSTAPVIVLIRALSTEAIDPTLQLGGAGIVIGADTYPKNEREEALTHLAAWTSARNAACLVEWKVTDQIPAELHKTGIDGLILTDVATVNPSFLKELTSHLLRKLRMPLFFETDDLLPRQRRPFLRAGVLGYVLTTYLEEAYTAGLRTGLRDRGTVLPVRYARYARKAAEEAVYNLYKDLNR